MAPGNAVGSAGTAQVKSERRNIDSIPSGSSQHRDPDDFGYRHAYKAVSFAYARCAGARAVSDLIDRFEEMPADTDRDDRWIPLVALLVTGSKEGVAFVLDHVDWLLDQMEVNRNRDGNEARVLRAAAGCLVFGDDPRALREISVFRDVEMMGATSAAETRPNDYNSDFFWIASSKASLREDQEIRSEWARNSAAIRRRWMDLLE